MLRSNMVLKRKRLNGPVSSQSDRKSNCPKDLACSSEEIRGFTRYNIIILVCAIYSLFSLIYGMRVLFRMYRLPKY